MKIGFDVAQTCEQRAGCGWYADSLIRALVKTAPEHQYLLYHQYGNWINQNTDHGTKIDSPSVTPTFLDVTPKEAARIWNSPEELALKAGQPDIIQANSFQASRVPGAKLVFTVYDVSFWAVPNFTTEENRLACQNGMLQALGKADGFVFISQSTHDEFERLLPGWLDKNRRPWAVTPLASRAVSATTPLSQSKGDYWLAIGSLEPRKNYETLLKAMELYWQRSSRRLPLKIAGGPGWKSEALKQRIRALSADNMVTQLGYVPDEELPALYAGAMALIFPSWYEGFGLPVLEAMAHGCPVLCSKSTSLPEVGGAASLYIEPDNPRQIADTMLEFESDAAARNARVHASLDQASSFTWERTAKLTLDLYERILHPNR